MGEPDVLEMTIGEWLEQFVSDHADGVQKREAYFSQSDFELPLPNGKTLRLCADFVSTAKLNNLPEA